LPDPKSRRQSRTSSRASGIEFPQSHVDCVAAACRLLSVLVVLRAALPARAFVKSVILRRAGRTAPSAARAHRDDSSRSPRSTAHP
jgi:hypothetical protein